VALRELVRTEPAIVDTSIYHKNLMPVTYVTGDVAGAMESPVYAILKLGPEMDKFKAPEGMPSSSTWRPCRRTPSTIP
jgi:multidrug efflux pump subunit AcrB